MTDNEPTPERLARRVKMAGLVFGPLLVLAGCAARPPSRAASGAVASPAVGAPLDRGLGELEAIESGPEETPGATVRLPLPGPCVSLRKDAAQDPLFERAYRPFDLDGDGVRDVVIVRTGGAAQDAAPSNELYVLRGRCAHHLIGEIPGRALQLSAERSNGLADVVARGASVHFLCPEETEAIWKFDGRTYATTARCPAAAASRPKAPE